MSETVDVEKLQKEVEALRNELMVSYRKIELGRLASGVIHEINTPIASIFSNLEVLQKLVDGLEKNLEGGATPKSRQLLDMMRSLLAVDKVACERISGIIRSLKIHARMEEEDFRKVDLNELLDDSIRLVNAEYKRRVKIVTEYQEIPLVECRPQLMSQVFINILVNGAQAIPGEGTITVRTSVKDTNTEISISDTGTGMSTECKDKVFSTGFSTKPIGIGTGIGLPLSRKIVVEIHHGTIRFESEPGKGTTFFITIPTRQEAVTNKAGTSQ